jgi:hypothetical protein
VGRDPHLVGNATVPELSVDRGTIRDRATSELSHQGRNLVRPHQIDAFAHGTRGWVQICQTTAANMFEQYAVASLTTVPGISYIAAQVLVAEIGVRHDALPRPGSSGLVGGPVPTQ